MSPALRKKQYSRKVDKCGTVLSFGDADIPSYRRSWIIDTVLDGIQRLTMPIPSRGPIPEFGESSSVISTRISVTSMKKRNQLEL